VIAFFGSGAASVLLTCATFVSFLAARVAANGSGVLFTADRSDLLGCVKPSCVSILASLLGSFFSCNGLRMNGEGAEGGSTGLATFLLPGSLGAGGFTPAIELVPDRSGKVVGVFGNGAEASVLGGTVGNAVNGGNGFRGAVSAVFGTIGKAVGNGSNGARSAVFDAVGKAVSGGGGFMTEATSPDFGTVEKADGGGKFVGLMSAVFGAVGNGASNGGGYTGSAFTVLGVIGNVGAVLAVVFGAVGKGVSGSGARSVEPVPDDVFGTVCQPFAGREATVPGSLGPGLRGANVISRGLVVGGNCENPEVPEAVGATGGSRCGSILDRFVGGIGGDQPERGGSLVCGP
jgi:hypothetical protein